MIYKIQSRFLSTSVLCPLLSLVLFLFSKVVGNFKHLSLASDSVHFARRNCLPDCDPLICHRLQSLHTSISDSVHTSSSSPYGVKLTGRTPLTDWHHGSCCSKRNDECTMWTESEPLGMGKERASAQNARPNYAVHRSVPGTPTFLLFSFGF